jgi:hypothetical protein
MSNNHINKRVFLCLLFTLPTCSNAIELGISGELMFFDYEEVDPLGNSLNREKGLIPGLTFSGIHQYDNISNTLELSIYDGQVDYNGQTQAGQPHQTTTEETILRLTYRLGWSPASTRAAFYGSAYWQQWERDIQATNGIAGLFERYEWWTVEAGVQAPFFRDDSQHLFLEMGMLATRNGDIMIDLGPFGYGSHTLNLGNSIGFASALKYQLKQAQNGRLQFGLQFKTWDFGRSNSKTISNGSSTITITEPESTTYQTTISASYIHSF